MSIVAAPSTALVEQSPTNVRAQGASAVRAQGASAVRAQQSSARAKQWPLPELIELPLEAITLFKFKPREHFNQGKLDQLAQHIRENGLHEPIVVREGPWRGGQTYDLVIGERRWRAAHLAGLESIPALVWTGVGHQEAVAAALAENILHEPLSVIEEARAFDALRQLGMKVIDIAARVGRGQPAVSNTLKLLHLPPEMQQMLLDREISASMARALMRRMAEMPNDGPLNITDLAHAVLEAGSPVKEIERGLPAPVLARLPPPVARAASPTHPAPPRHRPSLCPRRRPGEPPAARLTSAHFVPACCRGQRCRMCGNRARHRIAEDVCPDDPTPERGGLTAYVCCTCFGEILGRAAHRACGVDIETVGDEEVPRDGR